MKLLKNHFANRSKTLLAVVVKEIAFAGSAIGPCSVLLWTCMAAMNLLSKKIQKIGGSDVPT